LSEILVVQDKLYSYSVSNRHLLTIFATLPEILSYTELT